MVTDVGGGGEFQGQTSLGETTGMLNTFFFKFFKIFIYIEKDIASKRGRGGKRDRIPSSIFSTFRHFSAPMMFFLLSFLISQMIISVV